MRTSSGIGSFAVMGQVLALAGEAASERRRRRSRSEESPRSIMREAMRKQGRMRASELAQMGGVPSSMVAALFKRDLIAGRVIKVIEDGGVMAYELPSGS